MTLKKVCSAGMALALAAGLLAGTASAHHGQGGHCRQTWKSQISVCTVEDCCETGRHLHNGVIYAGRGLEKTAPESEVRIAVCPLEGCTQTGRHIHEGVSYCGYAHADGYCDGTCQVALCPLEDCGETGLHTHGETHYCGYAHTCGYCDGTCQAGSPVYSEPAESVPVCGGHHHGGHHH